MDPDKHWVGTWATSPAPSVAAEGFNNHTLRMNARVSIGGDTLRVRVSNAYGDGKLEIGAASLGVRDSGPAIVSGSERPLTFGGSGSATVAAGAVAISDSVQLAVPPLADLAISLYLPGTIPPDFQITGRYARKTKPVGKITDEWYFVCGIDVLASEETGGVVTLGDSLTDANVSTHDAFCRWPDQLARRLVDRPEGRPLGVMNQGLGGNRILHDLRGESGLRRFDRDVLAQPGVTHAIVMLGTNDLRNRNARPEEEVTAEQMIAGLQQMALRAEAGRIKLFGATLTPFGGSRERPRCGSDRPACRDEHQEVLNRKLVDPLRGLRLR